MKITLDRERFMSAIAKAKNFVDGKYAQRPAFCYIQCDVTEESELHILALDTSKCYESYLPCQCSDNDEFRRFILPGNISIPKKGAPLITIDVTASTVTVGDGFTSQIFNNDSGMIVHYTLDEFLPQDEPKETIWFNSVHIEKAVKGYSGLVRFDIFDSHQPLVITYEDDGDRSLVMPVNHNKQR